MDADCHPRGVVRILRTIGGTEARSRDDHPLSRRFFHHHRNVVFDAIAIVHERVAPTTLRCEEVARFGPIPVVWPKSGPNALQ
jgi:hypothetical protein